jgi:4-hydroxythreonine-4-phosphate dehydrogenase
MHKPQDKNKKIKIGITHGDFNGVGYELIIKSFADNRILDMFTPIIYGSAKIASYYKKALHSGNVDFNVVKNEDKFLPKRINLINIHDKEEKVEPGKSTKIAGELAFKSLEKAIEAIKKNQFDVLVTAPINKDNIQSEEFNFPGHTEYLAKKFDSENYLMLMVCDSIRLGVVTGHMPLKDVSSNLTIDLIMNKVRIMNESLIKDFGIEKPKIALLSLNPHAGDNGLLGKEEEEVIIPAIKKASEEGMLTYGPYPADGFIGSRSYNNFDGVLAMYHDQGMIAFKSLAFDSGVNFTAGLPIIRTSPAHGTAYNLVGKNQASTESFQNAIYLAIDIYNNRKTHEHITKNPLQKAEIDLTPSNGNGNENNNDKEVASN